MSEEFIADIIDNPELSKNKPEMVADLQGSTDEKISEKKAESINEGAKSEEQAKPDAAKTEVATSDSADPVKELASQLGWREDYIDEDHIGDGAVDAATYILKSKDIQKSMGQHNKYLKEQLQTLNNSVDALREHNSNVYQANIKKLQVEVADLRKDRRAAIELADVDKVEELDQQIEDKQKDINAPVEERPTGSNPVYDSWIQDNDWYLTDDDMAQYADNVAEQYIGAPTERIYALVRSKVQEVFPDRFEKQTNQQTKPVIDKVINKSVDKVVGPNSPVEGSSTKVAGSSFSKADLSQDQLQIMKQFVHGGIMTEEQYIKDIAAMQE